MIFWLHKKQACLGKIAFIIGLYLSTSLAVQAQIQVYKVERTVSPRNDSYGDDIHGLSTLMAQFEIGAAVQGEKPLLFPDRQGFENMVLIGSAGISVKISFVEFEKICEYLCGDELEECHYTGLVSWTAS